MILTLAKDETEYSSEIFKSYYRHLALFGRKWEVVGGVNASISSFLQNVNRAFCTVDKIYDIKIKKELHFEISLKIWPFLNFNDSVSKNIIVLGNKLFYII